MAAALSMICRRSAGSVWWISRKWFICRLCLAGSEATALKARGMMAVNGAQAGVRSRAMASSRVTASAISSSEMVSGGSRRITLSAAGTVISAWA